MRTMSFLLDIFSVFIKAFCMYRMSDELFSRRLFINKKSRKNNWKLIAILIIVCMSIIIFLNQIQLSSTYITIIFVVYSIIMFMIFWTIDWVSLIEIIVGYLVGLIFCLVLQISIMKFVGEYEWFLQTLGMQEWMKRLIHSTIYESEWILINILLIKLIRKYFVTKEDWKDILFLSGVGIVVFLFLLDYILATHIVSMNASASIFIKISVISMFLMYYNIRNRNLIIKLRIMDMQNETLERNYEQVSKYYEENARLYHDMKHHFDALYYMLEEGMQNEAKDYLVTLKTPNHSYMLKHYTGIDMIDTIISDKTSIAEKKEIDIVIEAQALPDDIVVENKDLCALFANLLDNAIEASPKNVSLSIKLVHRILVIQIKNDYQNELKKEHGKYRTTKKNSMYHSWGLQSVETVVNRYDGSMNINVEEGIFCVDLILNV